MRTPLEGTVALLTGAARGLGLAAARRLAEDGAAVVIADLDAEAAHSAAAGLESEGKRALGLPLDVCDEDSVRAVVADGVDVLGGLDILVNNAGVARDHRLEDLGSRDWDTVVDTTLKGAYLCSRAALDALRDSGRGRIVNISSRAYLGNPGQANYSSAKAGIIGLTRSLSMELGPAGITVNAVAPGMIDTDLVRSHPKSEAIIERAVKATPLRRIGSPSEVAAAVAFLASEDAGFITGDVLHVTGGRY